MTARIYDVPAGTPAPPPLGTPFPTGIDPIPAAAIAMQVYGPEIVDGFSHSNGAGWTLGLSDMTHRRALGSGVSQAGLFSPAFDGSASAWSDQVGTTNDYPPPALAPRREAVATEQFSDRRVGINVGDVWTNCGAQNARNEYTRVLPVLMFGSRTEAKADIFVLRSSTGLQSVSGLGFQPDVVILLGAHRSGATNGCAFEIGAFDADGNQWAVAERSVYLSGNGVLLNQVTRSSRFATDACLLHLGAQEFAGPTSVNQRAVFSSMDADGFTIDVTDAGLDSSGNASRCMFIALQLVGGSAQVGSAFQDDAGIAVAFAPDAMLFASNIAPDESEQNYATIQLGMADATEQRGLWAGADSGTLFGPAPPSFADFSSTYAIFSGAAHGSVTLVPEGADITWDVTDAIVRPFGWIAFLSDDVPTPMPSATTEFAQAACDRAILYGTVEPGVGVAHVFFDWGTTIAYGNVVDAGFISGAPDLVSAEIFGLSEGGTYHFRIRIIVDGVCVFVGDDMVFTVDPCARGLRVLTQKNSDPSYSTPDAQLQ